MKVGDYVRTRWGCIAKFEGINEGFYEFDNIIMDESSAVREKLFVDIVEKSSPNIIDLIEEDDFINGMRITELKSNKNGVIKCMVDSDYEFITTITNAEIESVVTKEQFESMKYRIGE